MIEWKANCRKVWGYNIKIVYERAFGCVGDGIRKHYYNRCVFQINIIGCKIPEVYSRSKKMFTKNLLITLEFIQDSLLLNNFIIFHSQNLED
jgi:hypothetical protein